MMYYITKTVIASFISVIIASKVFLQQYIGLKYLYFSCSLHVYIYIWVPRFISKSFFQLLLLETIESYFHYCFPFHVAAVSFVTLWFAALVHSIFPSSSHVNTKPSSPVWHVSHWSHLSSSSPGALGCFTGAQHSGNFTPMWASYCYSPNILLGFLKS